MCSAGYGVRSAQADRSPTGPAPTASAKSPPDSWPSTSCPGSCVRGVHRPSLAFRKGLFATVSALNELLWLTRGRRRRCGSFFDARTPHRVCRVLKTPLWAFLRLAGIVAALRVGHVVSHTKGGSKKDGPTQGPLNIAGRCPAQGGEAGGQGRYGRAQLSTEPAEAPGGGTEPERMTGQGREAAPAGWRGPQRSEDTGRTGRTLDAAGVPQRSRHGRGDVGRRP